MVYGRPEAALVDIGWSVGMMPTPSVLPECHVRNSDTDRPSVTEQTAVPSFPTSDAIVKAYTLLRGLQKPCECRNKFKISQNSPILKGCSPLSFESVIQSHIFQCISIYIYSKKSYTNIF